MLPNTPPKTWDQRVREDIRLIGCLTDAELFDGSSAVRARKPIHTKTLCEEMGLDVSITNREASNAFIAACDAWLNGEIKWDTWKAEVAGVHKRRGQYHKRFVFTLITDD
jgi:hypothetical protein